MLLERAVRAHPNSAIAYYRLAEIEGSLGAARDAVALLERAVQLSPAYAAAHYALAQAYREQGRADKVQLHLALFRQNEGHQEPLLDPLLYEISRLRSDAAPNAAAQERFERVLKAC